MDTKRAADGGRWGCELYRSGSRQGTSGTGTQDITGFGDRFGADLIPALHSGESAFHPKISYLTANFRGIAPFFSNIETPFLEHYLVVQAAFAATLYAIWIF